MANLLTIQQAAERLNLTERGIRRLVINEGLPTIRLGRTLRFDPNDLDAFVASCKQQRSTASWPTSDKSRHPTQVTEPFPISRRRKAV
ncbi:MAG: Helix-turn-helix domain [Acidimicrobiaceae bacterium]|jgi:excisionase family DNA binding protein